MGVKVCAEPSKVERIKTTNQRVSGAEIVFDWGYTFTVKKEIANYIKKFSGSGKPLTDSQARIIAYWELVDFQSDIDEPSKRYRETLDKFLKEID